MQYVWVILLFLPSALSQSKEKIVVVVPDAPVFSVSGSEVILSCSVREMDHPNIKKNAVDMNVTWSRSDLRDSLVHLYGNHKDLNTDQNPSYRGRTAVIKEELKNGNASLKLSNVRISDEGEYTCRVESIFWEDNLSVKLLVEVMGSEPVITVEKYESGKFSLLCESNGWHFEPELQWRNSKEVNLTSETETQPVADLFNVKSRITVEKIDTYFCTVTRKDNVKKGWIDAKTLQKHVPGENWTAVVITIVALLIVGVLAGFILYHCNEMKRIEEKQKEMKRIEEIQKVIAVLPKITKVTKITKPQSNSCQVTLSRSEENVQLILKIESDISTQRIDELKETLEKTFGTLSIVELWGCNITEEICEVLASALSLSSSETRELDLSYNVQLKDSGVEKLSKGLKNEHCKLEILKLWGCTLTGKSCELLASVIKSDKSTLRKLDLSYNELKDSGVEKLCEGLKIEHCNLQKLELERCGITDKGCATLFNTLTSNTSSNMRKLNLNYNQLESTESSKITALSALSDLLNSTDCKLVKLLLTGCHLNENICGILAEVLKSDRSLRELSLGKNDLKDSGVEKLCVGLKDEKCKLVILGLFGCGIKDDGCAALFEALKTSKLRELNLNRNKLGENALEKLCELLKGSERKLQRLLLNGCNITEKGCSDIFEALKSSNLRELSLNSNKPGKEGIAALSGLLQHPKCKLEKLQLRLCDLSDEDCNVIAKQSEKSSLRELDLSYNKVQQSNLKKIYEIQENAGWDLYI